MSDQLRDEEKWENPRTKKLKFVMRGEPVTAILKSKEIAVTDFDDYNESSRAIMSSSSSGVVLEEIFACPICSKPFNSQKAVHGHMRSHPDRAYRGMPPPKKSTRPIRIKTCSDDQNVAGCSGSVNCDEVEEELMVGAAYGIMLIATGDDRYRIRTGSGKKRTRENEEAESKDFDKASMEDLSNYCVKAVDDSTSSRLLHICKECNKSFASGQALGGHKRYHFKPRLAEFVAADLTRLADVVAANLIPDVVPVYRSFDLNEIPADI